VKVCSFEGCGRRVVAHGLCTGHNAQVRKGRELTPIKPAGRQRCTVEGCGHLVNAGGLCSTHYAQHRQVAGPACSFSGCDGRVFGHGLCPGHNRQRRLGIPLHPLRPSGSDVIIEGDSAKVPIFNNRAAVVAHALIDARDAALVRERTWCLSRGYAVSGVRTGPRQMHRLILDCPSGLEVDHINGDKLDNRRSNLRIVTRAQNAQNVPRSKRNVYRQPRGSYMVLVTSGRRQHYGGTFRDLHEAHEAAARLRSDLLPFAVEGRK
jgi:hypothetical protein